MGDDKVLFREVQRFCQPWLVVLAAVPLAVVVVAYGYGIIKLVNHESFGNNPTSYAAILITGLGALLLCLGVLVLMLISKLETEVRVDGLFVRFYPFHLRERKIELEKVVSFRDVTYRPIWDYGGWGLRFGKGGRAYNVSGRSGVRLEFANGKHLLIGSQRSEELAAAIESLFKT